MTASGGGAAALSYPLHQWASGGHPTSDGLYLNGNAVVLGGGAALILGASGAGKSEISLALMAYGAQLLSDDGLWARAVGGKLTLTRPKTAPDAIEQRGIGLLPVPDAVASATCVLVIDLDRSAPRRLPEPEYVSLDGARVRCLALKGIPNPAPAIVQILRHGAPLSV